MKRKLTTDTSFTLVEDNRILKGLLESESDMFEELALSGHDRTDVLKRALALGVTREFIVSYNQNNTSAAMRKCLRCGKHFASAGLQNRLCQRCK